MSLFKKSMHIIDGNFTHNPTRPINSAPVDQILLVLKQAVKHK